jgi:hypothetical protein
MMVMILSKLRNHDDYDLLKNLVREEQKTDNIVCQ